MKNISIVLLISIAVMIFSGCEIVLDTKENFNIKNNDVTIWQTSTGECHIVLAVEVTNNNRKPLYFRPSTFDIVDEYGNLIDTMENVNSYPATVRPGEEGVYYNTKMSDKIKDLDMKLYTVPHIETEVSTLTNNQLVQLGIEGVTTGGSRYSSGVVSNISNRTEYKNVHVAIIGRSMEGKVVSVMTTVIDSIGPRERVSFFAEDSLKERDLGPNIVTSYKHFAYVIPSE